MSRSNLIAIVSIDVVNPHYNAMINKVADRIQEIGKEPLFFVSPEEKSRRNTFDYSISVGAILVLSAYHRWRLSKIGSVVVFNKYTVNKTFLPFTDNVQSGLDGCNYLMSRKTFACHGFTTFLGTSRDRLRIQGLSFEKV